MTDLISDLYKDAYGFRPSREWMKTYNSLSLEEQLAEDVRLEKIIVSSIEEEKNEQKKNYNIWFNSVSKIATSNAVSIGTAIRWDMEAHDAVMGGRPSIGYYCYQTGIGYENESFIAKLLGIENYVAGID